jgi:hypothetical protein
MRFAHGAGHREFVMHLTGSCENCDKICTSRIDGRSQKKLGRADGATIHMGRFSLSSDAPHGDPTVELDFRIQATTPHPSFLRVVEAF